MKRLAMILATLGVALLWAISAHAAADPDKRVALVIGNSNYRLAVPLPNPVNDAKLMSTTLRDVGFEVVEGLDLDKAGMMAIIDRFTEASYDADLAVIYYAGHGIQVDGKNFLIPVDAELSSPAHLKTRAFAVDDLLGALPSDPAIGVIILDACRDNPLARSLAKSMPATRSVTLGSGLAAVQASSDGTGTGGVLIAYATDPGAIAMDGKGENSPYTTALVKYLALPGVELQSALTRVRGEVTEKTLGRQRPWHNASLGREVFIGGSAADAPAAPQIVLGTPKTQEQQAEAAAVANTAWEFEQRLWDEASKRNTIAHYNAYLEQFPEGRFAAIARINIDDLGKPATQQMASAAPTIQESGSAVRTAMSVPEELKTAPGTEITETAIGLDKQARVDLQLRLEALGHELGGVDGSLGPKSRVAIGAWQEQNGIVRTSFLTRDQYAFLVVQTDPMMAAVRARHERDLAAAQEKRKQQQAAAQKRQTQKTTKTATNRGTGKSTKPKADVNEGPVGGGGFDSDVGAFAAGALVGGVIGAINK